MEYRSAETHYRCAVFEDKVRAILQAVGARDQIAVEARCGRQARNRISAQIAVITAVPATADNIRAATTFDTRDELIARVRNIDLPRLTDIPRFTAQWQAASMAHIQGAFLTGEDCDLLRSVAEQVFPRLAVRVVKNRLNCDGSAARLRPVLEVQALMPVSQRL